MLTSVCLALSSKKKIYSVSPKIKLFFLKILKPYWAPKNVKRSSIIEEYFARVDTKGIKNYQHNYSTQTLSSTSWHVAGISQVNKAYN